jgi:hypothetical protein
MAKTIWVALALVAASGCIATHNEDRPASWPEPGKAADVKEFEGVFSNRSVDRATGQPGNDTAQLFDFLTGQGHSHGERGVNVEIRSDTNQAVLRLRLLDNHGVEIDSADLHVGTDCQLINGFLELLGPFSGTHSHAGNLGSHIENQSFRLYLSSERLLGRQSEHATGLLFYLFPYAGGGKVWMFWPHAGLP